MGITKPVLRKRKNPFEPTEAEVARWHRLPKVQAKCKSRWMNALVADAVLERLCFNPNDGEYRYDPIAMTIACINDPERFSHAQDPVWQAAYATGQAQLKFARCVERVSKKYKVNMLSIRRTCDPMTLPQ